MGVILEHISNLNKLFAILYMGFPMQAKPHVGLCTIGISLHSTFIVKMQTLLSTCNIRPILLNQPQSKVGQSCANSNCKYF